MPRLRGHPLVSVITVQLTWFFYWHDKCGQRECKTLDCDGSNDCASAAQVSFSRVIPAVFFTIIVCSWLLCVFCEIVLAFRCHIKHAHFYSFIHHSFLMSTTTTSSPPPLTLGMQLDAALSQLDSLSSPQLYSLIVLVTVLIATLLLGNAQPLDEAKMMKNVVTTTTTSSNIRNNNKNNKTTSSTSLGREPRWYIFRLFNYAMLTAFSLSVVEFLLHADRYAKDQTLLMRVLAAWCLCLIYFFGFFGVSIVHSECLPQEEDEEGAVNNKAG